MENRRREVARPSRLRSPDHSLSDALRYGRLPGGGRARSRNVSDAPRPPRYPMIGLGSDMYVYDHCYDCEYTVVALPLGTSPTV